MKRQRLDTRHGRGGLVVIGRNVDTEPMSETIWRLYTNDIVTAIEAYGGAVYAVANGVGQWGGTLEETSVIVFGGPPVRRLHPQLALLAAVYDQDTIATVGGANWLVRRAANEEPIYVPPTEEGRP